jgi:hypothetical protein
MDDPKQFFVLLPSGKLVPAIRDHLEPGEETPEHLLAWLDGVGQKWPKRIVDFKRKLCTDRRMREFWDWLGTVKFTRHDKFRSSLSVTEDIRHATRMPSFPGNLTAKQREAYFGKVRGHAQALIGLLRNTKFDREYLEEIPEKTLARPLAKELTSWADDEAEEGHTVAFQVTPDGAYRHHYDYPHNALSSTLCDLLEWTHWEDNWDGNWFGSSAPIAQANASTTPTIYFCCTLHDSFRQHGVEIPFPLLATVANVALDLSDDRQLDEDTARKQVRRYQERLQSARACRPEAFDGAPGQNLPDWDDSVLSDPF